MALSGDAELTVTFVDASTPAEGITYWLWDFGDGSAYYEGQTPPAHTYSTPGVYTVTLHVASAKGIDTFSDTVTVGDPNNPAVTSVTLVSPGIGGHGGLSVTVLAQPAPISSGRTVLLYWRKTSESASADRLIGTMAWNGVQYTLLWTLPSCAELPDITQAYLHVVASGWDGVEADGLGGPYFFPGRGC